MIPFWIDCLKNMIKRLVYIYKLVWDAHTALMFILAFMAVFNGVQSIIGAYISKMLLDRVRNWPSRGSWNLFRQQALLAALQNFYFN